jgi:hypothetical protein
MTISTDSVALVEVGNTHLSTKYLILHPPFVREIQTSEAKPTGARMSARTTFSQTPAYAATATASAKEVAAEEALVYEGWYRLSLSA